MKIKICGIKDQENLRSLLELSPDYAGFNFYKNSKRFCDFKLPPDLDFGSCQKVGVFVNSPIAEILSYIENYGLDCIQLHGDEDLIFCQELKGRLESVRIIKVFRVSDTLPDMSGWSEIAEYFLFDKNPNDSSYGGSGSKFDWSLLKDLDGDKPYFLAGGIGPSDSEVIRKLGYQNLFALDINSCFEISPGLKNTELIAEFIKEIRK